MAPRAVEAVSYTHLDVYKRQDLKAEREIVAIVVPTDRRASIMEAVNVQHGLRSPPQSVLCSLPIDHIVRLG